MGESGYAISSWSASAGYSASMLTEDAKVDSSSTRQLLPSSVNISAEYPALPDHDSMNNPSICYVGIIKTEIFLWIVTWLSIAIRRWAYYLLSEDNSHLAYNPIPLQQECNKNVLCTWNVKIRNEVCRKFQFFPNLGAQHDRRTNVGRY